MLTSPELPPASKFVRSITPRCALPKLVPRLDITVDLCQIWESEEAVLNKGDFYSFRI